MVAVFNVEIERRLIMNLKTGDIVLFSGKCWVANTIKLLSWCKWSHVGMIIIDSRYDFPLVYESTHNNKIAGLDIGRNHMGVQVVPFHERVAQYDGGIAIRRLEDVELSDDDRYNLRLFRRAMTGREFEQDIKEMVAANYRLPFLKTAENLSSLFCSELIAQAYMELGLLCQCIPSNKYVPAHFSSKRNTQLLRGKLSNEEIIK